MKFDIGIVKKIILKLINYLFFHKSISRISPMGILGFHCVIFLIKKTTKLWINDESH